MVLYEIIKLYTLSAVSCLVKELRYCMKLPLTTEKVKYQSEKVEYPTKQIDHEHLTIAHHRKVVVDGKQSSRLASALKGQAVESRWFTD